MKFPRRSGAPLREPDGSDADPGDDPQTVRGRFGIEALEEDEELLDAALFESIQSRFEAAREDVEGDAAARAEGPSQADDAVEELLLEDVATGPEPRRRRGDVLPPPASIAGVVELEEALRTAPDLEAIARIALRLARRYACGAALFVVQRDLIAGLRAEIDEQDRSVEGILVPLAAESLFSRSLANRRGMCRRGAHCDIDARILRALGRSREQEFLVAPVLLRGRVMSLLYADNGPAPLPATSLAALGALAGEIAAAFEAVILARKRRGS